MLEFELGTLPKGAHTPNYYISDHLRKYHDLIVQELMAYYWVVINKFTMNNLSSDLMPKHPLYFSK